MSNRITETNPEAFCKKRLRVFTKDTFDDIKAVFLGKDSICKARRRSFLLSLLPAVVIFAGVAVSFKLMSNWAVDRYISGLMPLREMEYSYSPSGEPLSLFDTALPMSATGDAQQYSVYPTPDGIFPRILWNEQFGKLSIESAGIIDLPVFKGDSETQLSRGIGHFSGSRFPGQGGNIVLAGHRNTDFKPLANGVAIGETVRFETFYGDYVYRISSTQIVDGNDPSLLYPDDTAEKLTIYTCYPFNYVGHAPNRFYLICDYVSGPKWDKEAGRFYIPEGAGVQ